MLLFLNRAGRTISDGMFLGDIVYVLATRAQQARPQAR
jgi:hypothetical protein